MRTTPTKKQIQAQKTKKQLYENAIKLFAERGYSAVTIEEICAQSNLTKGTFYVHFNSKHDIVIEQSKNTDKAQADYYEAMDKTRPYAEQLYDYLTFICDNIQTDKGIDTERAIYAAELNKDNAPGYIINESRPIYSIMRKIITQGKESGEFKKDVDTDKAVNMCICVIRGVLFEWMITYNTKRADAKEMCSSLAKAVADSFKN